MSLYHWNSFTAALKSSFLLVMLKLSWFVVQMESKSIYFIADLEVHQIWREIVVKILLRGFSYWKLFHAFESLQRIEFLIKFVLGLEGNDVLVSSAAWIPLYKELLKFPGGVTFAHLKKKNSSYHYRTQSWLVNHHTVREWKLWLFSMAIVNYLNSLDFLNAGELLKDQKGKEILDERFHVRLLI